MSYDHMETTSVLKEIRDNLRENNKQLGRIADIMEADLRFALTQPLSKEEEDRFNRAVKGILDYRTRRKSNEPLCPFTGIQCKHSDTKKCDSCYVNPAGPPAPTKVEEELSGSARYLYGMPPGLPISHDREEKLISLAREVCMKESAEKGAGDKIYGTEYSMPF